MKLSDIQAQVSQEMQELSGQLLALASSAWNAFKGHHEVTQEVTKDPFTGPAKEQAATAELLILLLHACDRVASAAFNATLPEHTAASLRTAFMSALVGSALLTFVRQACPEADEAELEETEADLLHLYNARTLQYGFFSLGGSKAAQEGEPLFTVASIRLTEALECADNAEIIVHGIDVAIESLTTLRTQLPLKETIGRIISRASV